MFKLVIIVLVGSVKKLIETFLIGTVELCVRILLSIVQNHVKAAALR